MGRKTRILYNNAQRNKTPEDHIYKFIEFDFSLDIFAQVFELKST